ncbi:MAG: hypothetical protein QM754_06480 [Tepidisphaeraceae bacterium]
MFAHRLPVVRFAAIGSMLFAAGVRADSLILQGTPPQRVTISGFSDGKLQYATERGSAAEREYARIQQIAVDNEPALTIAETARIGNQADAALSGYVKAIRGSSTAWVKAYAARRIADANTDKFEPRLVAYVGLLQIASPDAPAAKPALPERGSRLLDSAVSDVENALKSPQLADAPKLALFNFLAELHGQRGDDAAVTATVERMARSSPAAANDPVVQSRLVGLKVSKAKAAAEKNDFAAALKIINDVQSQITDPQQQADAFFIIAQAKLASADKSDTPARQDAALAFMRVVVVAKNLPGRPNMLVSLRATAGILEQTGDPAGAAKLYGQIARDFADDPAAAAEAKADVQRLQGK